MQLDARGARDTGIFVEEYRDEDARNSRQPSCQGFMAAVEGMLLERSRELCDLFGLTEEGS